MQKIVGGVLAFVLWSALLVGSGDALTLWPAVSTTAGLPWFPTQQGDQPLPAAVGFTSTTTESIDQVTVPLGMTGSDSRFQLEVYESDDVIPGDVTTTTYRPNDDLTIGGDDSEDNAWLKPGFPPTDNNLFQAINGTTVDPDIYMYYGNTTATQANGKRYRFNVNSAAWGAGRRVVGGAVRIVANRVDANGVLQVGYFNGAQTAVFGTITVTPNRAVYNVPFPETNPLTGYPWTQAQIVALDSTAAIQLRPVNVNRQKILKVYQASVNLDWVTENRVAVGVLDVAAQASGTATAFTLRDPNTGADNWSKAAAQAYTTLIRRTGGFAQAAWRFLTESEQVSDALLRPDQNVGLGVESSVPLMDSRGSVSVVGAQVPGRGQSFYLTRTDAAVSVDGQPYGFSAGREFDFPNPGGDVSQTFTPATTGTYGLARVLLAPGVYQGVTLPSTPVAASQMANVDVSVRVVGTNALVGSAVTLTAEDILASPSFPTSAPDFQTGPTAFLVDIPLTGVALTASTDYYIRFRTAQAATVAAGDPFWAVMAAVGPALAAGPTFQSDTGYFSRGSAPTTATATDIALTLSTLPTAPTALTADQETVDNDPDLEAAGCTISETERIVTEWTPTALGADFGRYELQRDDDASGFVTIAEGTDEDSDTYPDPESVRAEAADYRLRVIRAGDWIPSAWTSTATATANPVGSEVVFAAAWLAEALAVNRGPEIEWPQPNNDGTLQLAGRDFQIRFQEAEARGDGGASGFDIPVVVYYGHPGQNQPTPDGRAAFSPLIDFLRTYVPYMTCLFADGSRWYGRATLDPASISNSPDAAGNYSATVNMLVTQATPTPVPIPSAGS